MLTYTTLKDKPRELLAMTSLTASEFEAVLPTFSTAYAALQSATHTQSGAVRQRRAGGGRKATLGSAADKLLFILVYQKMYPVQTFQGLQFGLSQGQVNEWIQRLLPVLQTALAQQGYAPERDPAAVAQLVGPPNGPLALMLDGTERRQQRSQTPAKQRENYSGKKKAHTEKNLVLAQPRTRQVVYLSQTYAGSMNDKKMADCENLQFPAGTQLTQDMGFQGYAPPNVFIIQPKKQARGQFLSAADRVANRMKATARVVIEHVMAGIKRCRSVKDVLRNTVVDFSDLVMDVACGLHNLRVEFRYLRSVAYQHKNYFQ